MFIVAISRQSAKDHELMVLNLSILTQITIIMKSHLRTLFLQLIGSIMLCLSVNAQEPMVNLQFISLPEDQNSEPLDLMIDGQNTTRIELPSNRVSKNFQVPALTTWIFGKASVEKGKFHFEALGEAKSISANNQLIVVLRKSEEEGGGLVLIPIDYSNSTFGGGKYYFVNLTDVEIAGTIGKSEFSLEPNKFSLLNPEPDDVKGTRKYCFTELSYDKEGVMQPFVSATWRFNEKARSLVFFFRDPQTKLIKMHTVRSYVE